MNDSIVWLIIFVLTVIVEALTSGLVSIWFSIGAIGGFIISYITDNSLIQITVFTIVSVVSLLITKNFVKKILPKGAPKTNINKLIGETAVVTEKITDKTVGKVKIDGQIWSALNKEEGIIDEKCEVEVLYVEGVKLIVRKKDK